MVHKTRTAKEEIMLTKVLANMGFVRCFASACVETKVLLSERLRHAHKRHLMKTSI
jgi:hypothetical protein